MTATPFGTPGTDQHSTDQQAAPSHHLGRRALLTLGAAAVAGSLVASGDAPARAATTLDPRNFKLTASTRNSGAINKLSRALPHSSLTAIAAHADLTMSPTSLGLPHEVMAWSYDNDDATTTDWYPQGITSCFDGTGRDTVDGRSLLLTTWYDHLEDGVEQGSRIAVIDITDVSRPRYAYLLLVEPFIDDAGRGDFRAVPVHAGGIVWYGDWLQVVDTWNGIRFFDLRKLWQTTNSDPAAIGRQDDGSYAAHGYRWVLPQAFHYTDSTLNGVSEIRHSSLSLDRTSSPHSVVIAEYRNTADKNNGQASRVIRFPLQQTNGLLKTVNGVATATEVHDLDTNSMQSVTAVDGTWIVSQSDGAANNGDLATFTPPQDMTWYTDHLPVGTEDLTSWLSRDQLWTLAEHPGQRSIVAVQLSAYVDRS